MANINNVYTVREQSEAYPASVILSQEGDIFARSVPDIGNPDLCTQIHPNWDISPYTNVEKLKEFLESPAMTRLFKRIHKGHSVKWDDGMGHHRGHLTESAQADFQKVKELLDEFCEREENLDDVYTADEWANLHDYVDKDWPPHMSLDDVINKEYEKAKEMNVVIGESRNRLRSEILAQIDVALEGNHPVRKDQMDAAAKYGHV